MFKNPTGLIDRAHTNLTKPTLQAAALDGLVVVPIVQVVGALAMTADGATVAYAAVAPTSGEKGLAGAWRRQPWRMPGQGAETVTLGFTNEL